MLKIAGVKTDKQFYAKFPTQEAFMKVHGKAFKKAQVGAYIGGTANAAPKMLNYKDAYDQADMNSTGSTQDMRNKQMQDQAQIAANQKTASGKSGGFDISQLADIAKSFEDGGYIPMAQNGFSGIGFGNNGFNPGNTNVPNNIGFNPNSALTQSSGFPQMNAGQNFANSNPLPFNNTSVPSSIGNASQPNVGDQIAKGIPIVGDIVGGFQALHAEKEALQGARQMRGVTDLQLKASTTRPEKTERRYSRPEDALISGNQVNPSGGVGSNVLSRNGKKISKKKLKAGGEIQNTYDPNTLYDDLGYEPLNDSDQVKQFAVGGNIPQAANGFNNYMNTLGGGGSGFSGAGAGGSTPWGAIGNAGQSLAGAVTGGQNAGGQIGGAAGGAIGSIFGPGGKAIGQTLGALAGNMLDPYAKGIKKEQAVTARNTQGIANNSMGQAIQGQNASVMEDGGWVSHDWNPQVIAKFGDHSPEDVYDFAHKGMDTLRAGGHVRSYREPSEEALQTYAMGGELQTHWGGGIEEMSQNPYLPGDGITYMPHGQSHEESDGNGNTGIGITYGDNPVEVERREPMTKLRDGSSGEDSLVVYGNLQIPKYGVDLLGDKKAKGMKFKNYVNDLSKGEVRQNKIIESSTSDLDSLQVRNSFDKLKLSALEANIKGGNMKLKDIADKKIKAADLQNAINQTAEEHGLVADALAKGKAIQDKEAMKQQAKNGKILKAQYGRNNLSKYNVDFGSNDVNPSAIKLNEVVIPQKDYYQKELRNNIVGDSTPDYAQLATSKLPNNIYHEDTPVNYDLYNDEEVTAEKESADRKLKPWQTMLYNEILQRTRPSDTEALDPRQLAGEMYAMSNNQLEPVQAQLYHPQLQDANSRISLQDQMNEITAQSRAAQRMAGYNPAAQAAIAAQAYQAIDKVKGEEFRLNQDRFDKRSAENIATLNDAQGKNLGILDQQYQRQAAAKSNTKETTLAALNSISDKYAKNQLENRKLKAYENLYNYRYDDNGHLINMNPLAQFNTSGYSESKASGKDLPEGYEYIYDKNSKPIDVRKTPKEKSRNGSIVRSIKNI